MLISRPALPSEHRAFGRDASSRILRIAMQNMDMQIA